MTEREGGWVAMRVAEWEIFSTTIYVCIGLRSELPVMSAILTAVVRWSTWSTEVFRLVVRDPFAHVWPFPVLLRVLWTPGSTSYEVKVRKALIEQIQTELWFWWCSWHHNARKQKVSVRMHQLISNFCGQPTWKPLYFKNLVVTPDEVVMLCINL